MTLDEGRSLWADARAGLGATATFMLATYFPLATQNGTPPPESLAVLCAAAGFVIWWSAAGIACLRRGGQLVMVAMMAGAIGVAGAALGLYAPPGSAFVALAAADAGGAMRPASLVAGAVALALSGAGLLLWRGALHAIAPKAPLRRWLGERAKHYLERQGALALLKAGDTAEIPPDYADLASLHRLVRRLRPPAVLEFGCGFSTLVMAHALRQNGGGQIHAVETDEAWALNLRRKLPAELAPLVSITHSAARATTHAGELVHAYDRLPDCVPGLIYLDGPDPRAVQGDVRGLTFQPPGCARHAVAADILLYESTLKTGATIIADSRYINVAFLRRHLRRRWRVRVDRLRRQATFVLRERTGRH